VLEQVGALHGRVGDAELGDRLLVLAACAELLEDVVGDRRPA
jgi:hypothetical protein